MPQIPVVTSNGMSAVIKAQVLECNQCGHVWIQQTAELPERCPKRSCRKVDWNGPKRKNKKRLKPGPKPGRPRKDSKAHKSKGARNRKGR